MLVPKNTRVFYSGAYIHTAACRLSLTHSLTSTCSLPSFWLYPRDMRSLCDFNSWSPDGQWFWTFFFLCIYWPIVFLFFGEIEVYAFSPFVNWTYKTDDNIVYSSISPFFSYITIPIVHMCNYLFKEVNTFYVPLKIGSKCLTLF